jgi:hypothetical protein
MYWDYVVEPNLQIPMYLQMLPLSRYSDCLRLKGGVRFPAGSSHVYDLHSIQIGSEVHLATSTICTGGFSPWSRAVCCGPDESPIFTNTL